MKLPRYPVDISTQFAVHFGLRVKRQRNGAPRSPAALAGSLLGAMMTVSHDRKVMLW
ncbi:MULTISPECIES: hypothetical protein [unclassified Cupriavidus]|uniref:hypothetical protein n=1 Tax=unclassified Cupriavidus TaxID=2640874 RepID=UPI001C000B5D|nr:MULTISPECIES: hypothetical protein [unclassified Cupriavidus]MCA3185811.1 hypothetical protein [Cupriavidus sp.]MCA3191886.1 hypothetical protein [Cupriavidus sp.]MCA3197631.1 hypothetical protein [Cupriavidus sp.]MCA3202683.1 hypothetical protein [Cupriavidus sp.]MCA3232050.1 hypothetical protein [Cupriavidus sp.]